MLIPSWRDLAARFVSRVKSYCPVRQVRPRVRTRYPLGLPCGVLEVRTLLSSSLLWQAPAEASP
jgi:hypothetical protein